MFVTGTYVFYRCTQPHGHCQTMTVGDLSVPLVVFLRIFLQITLQQLQERLKSATRIDDIRCLDFYRLIIWSFIFDPNDLPLGTQKLFNPTSKVNLAAIGPQPLIQQSQKKFGPLVSSSRPARISIDGLSIGIGLALRGCCCHSAPMERSKARVSGIS